MMIRRTKHIRRSMLDMSHARLRYWSWCGIDAWGGSISSEEYRPLHKYAY